MEKPLNCWEYKGCGREPGGKNCEAAGVCPTAISEALDGIHRGDNAGRSCWVIAGTYCGGKVQGHYAMKINNCTNCDFFRLVMEEENTNLEEASHLLTALAVVAR